jgi:hypothetical protein
MATTRRVTFIGIGADGTVYFAYQANDGHQHAPSRKIRDKLIKDIDVGAALGIQNSVFPAALPVMGSRGSCFLRHYDTGSQLPLRPGRHCADDTGANPQPPFTGVWYLYIATTYDGGATWTTVNATPSDPIQRGGICGAGDCRNLLISLTPSSIKKPRAGRHDDGCISAGCIAEPRQ